MNVISAELSTVAALKTQFPAPLFPEIAFVGRSNVGKSSLINTLVARRSLARSSQTPGKTRTINFYQIKTSEKLSDEDKEIREFRFVDLPGYGYAKVSKVERDKWGRLIESYLKNRDVLKCVIMLVDLRHSLSENDRLMAEWLKFFEIKTIIAATKADKLSKTRAAESAAALRRELGMTTIAFSSITKQGRDTLWDLLLEML